MQRHKSVPADLETIEDLIATLEQSAADLGIIENEANKELRRTLNAAIEALTKAKQVGLKK